MSLNLLRIFNNAEIKNVAGKTTANIVDLSYRTNGKTGAKIARAVLDDGRTLVKTITASGIVSETIHKIPDISSIAQRNAVIKDLAKQRSFTQEMIAAMLNISQSTVSNVLKKK